MIKSALRRVGHALRVVIHDPEVQRSGRSFALLLAVRLALALGASAQVIEFLKSLS